MITVPEEIKERYHRDHCFKNIRIHFPNGERSDICNSLIVKDSVSFTESLCSQNQLKFGLCESPVFECETVGVGNIKGATIEVSVEIEAPRTLEGVIWRSEIQKYVYPISYGTFIVKESKRQADMQHRKILAYGIAAYYDFGVRSFQRYKFDYAATNYDAMFTQELPHLINETFQSDVFEMEYSEQSGYYNATFYTFDQQGVQHTHDYYFRRIKINEQKSHNLIKVKIDEPVAGKEKCILYDWWAQTAGTTSEMPHGSANYDWIYKDGLAYGFLYLYPEMSLDSSETTSFFTSKEYYISVLYKYEEHKRSELIKEINYFDPANISIYVGTRYTAYEGDYSWERALNNDSKYQVPSVDEIDFRNVFESYLEITGYIGKFDRDGSLSLIDIKRQFGLNPNTNLYPGASVYPEGVTGGKLLPGDYQSCWYDNEYRKPFGAVTCQYKDSNNQDTVLFKYISGFSAASDADSYYVYDLTNNEIVKSRTWEYEVIYRIIDHYRVRLKNLTYMPVEFVGRGLPYVETGDTFEILTRANDSITTIVLNRTIKGEQTLTDTYKSV